MFLKSLFSPFLSKKSRPIYYIIINKEKQGPLSFNDLKSHPRISPLTLVWKKGFKNWVPMGSIPDLRVIFEKKAEKKDQNHPPLKNEPEIVMEEGRFGFFPSLWWVILAVVLIIFVLFRFWISR